MCDPVLNVEPLCCITGSCGVCSLNCLGLISSCKRCGRVEIISVGQLECQSWLTRLPSDEFDSSLLTPAIAKWSFERVFRFTDCWGNIALHGISTTYWCSSTSWGSIYSPCINVFAVWSVEEFGLRFGKQWRLKTGLKQWYGAVTEREHVTVVTAVGNIKDMPEYEMLYSCQNLRTIITQLAASAMLARFEVSVGCTIHCI